MKSFPFLALFSLLLLGACTQQIKPITDAKDYNTYLEAQQGPTAYSLEADIQFWEDRSRQHPDDEIPVIKMAQLYAARFKQQGNYGDILLSDKLYHQVLDQQAVPSAAICQALAQNAITQHQFQQAKVYAEQARATGERQAASTLVLIDVALELGDDDRADALLQSFTNQHSFAHLVRQSKLSDHRGDLDTSIKIMEKAFDRIKGNADLYCWSLSNLGDMYGHAGRVDDAYNAYLAVLKTDPTYDYALKGIAWIALSHDRNYGEAKRIIEVLRERKQMPEADLLLAEIAEMEGNQEVKKAHLTRFVQTVNTPGIKTMYHKYLAEIYAEDIVDVNGSLAIANEEVTSRPTPQSYDLLAWSLLHAGQVERALEISRDYVQDRTSEPDALYHTGMIYLANRQPKKAVEFLKAAEESAFELGPVLTNKIRSTLSQI